MFLWLNPRSWPRVGGSVENVGSKSLVKSFGGVARIDTYYGGVKGSGRMKADGKGIVNHGHRVSYRVGAERLISVHNRPPGVSSDKAFSLGRVVGLDYRAQLRPSRGSKTWTPDVKDAQRLRAQAFSARPGPGRAANRTLSAFRLAASSAEKMTRAATSATEAATKAGLKASEMAAKAAAAQAEADAKLAAAAAEQTSKAAAKAAEETARRAAQTAEVTARASAIAAEASAKATAAAAEASAKATAAMAEATVRAAAYTAAAAASAVGSMFNN